MSALVTAAPSGATNSITVGVPTPVEYLYESGFQHFLTRAAYQQASMSCAAFLEMG
jgi:hypothetical protein